MSKFVSLSQPDLSYNSSTFLSADTQPGDFDLLVQNSEGFAQGEYVLLGKYGQEQAEIVPILQPVTLNGQITVGAPKFGHPADTLITKMDFNQYKIYRSITGVGGFYTLLEVKPLTPGNLENVYEDSQAVYPFSYRFTYFNDATQTETDFGPEIPFNGLPFYCLGSLTRRVLSLYGDKKAENIAIEDVHDWLNECTERMNWELMGGDSPYSLQSIVLPLNVTGNTYDLSGYDVIDIVLVEWSQNGTDFEKISGKDIRNGTGNNAYGFTFVNSKIEVIGVPQGGYLRVWYSTNPVLMLEDTDVPPLPLQAHSRIYIDWALQRAHESDRQINENSVYYDKKLERERLNVITRLRSRIKGNSRVNTDWADQFSGGYGIL